MSILTAAFLIVVFLAGLVAVFLGCAGLHFRRRGNGAVLLLVGALLVLWSARGLDRRFLVSDLEGKAMDVQDRLARVARERKEVEQNRLAIKKEAEELAAKLRERRPPGVALTKLMETDSGIRSLVEQIAQQNRWTADCDRAVAHFRSLEANLERTLFYLRNEQRMASIGDPDMQDAEVAEVLHELRERAATPEGGNVPVPVTESEVSVVDRMALARSK
jgi:hypothetical protein